MEEEKSWWFDYGQIISVLTIVLTGMGFILVLLHDQEQRMERLDDKVIVLTSKVHEIDKRLTIVEYKNDLSK